MLILTSVNNSILDYSRLSATKTCTTRVSQKITEPYLITFNSSKMDVYLNDISSQLYVIYSMI